MHIFPIAKRNKKELVCLDRQFKTLKKRRTGEIQPFRKDVNFQKLRGLHDLSTVIYAPVRKPHVTRLHARLLLLRVLSLIYASVRKLPKRFTSFMMKSKTAHKVPILFRDIKFIDYLFTVKPRCIFSFHPAPLIVPKSQLLLG